MVEDGEVVRAVHTSTGSLGRTPVGDFKVYAKVVYSWSVPFHVWMPWAAYFRGGIATHQSPDVPSYPASHGWFGCPRAKHARLRLRRRGYAGLRALTPLRCRAWMGTRRLLAASITLALFVLRVSQPERGRSQRGGRVHLLPAGRDPLG